MGRILRRQTFVPGLGGGGGGGWGLDPAAAGLTQYYTSSFDSGTVNTGTTAPDGLAFYGDGSFVSGRFRTSYPGNDAGNGTGGATIITENTHTARGCDRLKRLYSRLVPFFSLGYVVHENNGTEKMLYPLVVNSAGTVITQTSCGIGYPSTPAGGLVQVDCVPQTDRGPQLVFQTGTEYLVVNAANQRHEVFLQMNTPGNSDGIWRAWLNGVQVANRTDLNFASGVDGFWLGGRWTGTRGGGASSVLTPPGGQYREYESLEMWGATT